MKYVTLVATIAGIVGILSAEPKGENLLVNGGFDKLADGQPVGWERVDGLTTFVVDIPADVPAGNGRADGKCLLIDTDVLETEALARQKEMRAPSPPPAVKKTVPTAKQQYAVIGATYGVSLYSHVIPVKPGEAFYLEADYAAGSGGTPKIFVKGYASNVLLTGDIQYWQRFCAKLAASADVKAPSPERQIWHLLPDDARKIASKCAAGTELSDTEQAVFTEFMADLLRSRLFWSRTDFANVKIRADAGDLLKLGPANLDAVRLQKLNRSLLEAAFPDHIVKSPPLDEFDIRERRIYDTYLACRNRTDGWVTHRCMFHPTRRTPSVRYIRVMIYAYWPRGTYYFDNLRVVRVSESEYDAYKKRQELDFYGGKIPDREKYLDEKEKREGYADTEAGVHVVRRGKQTVIVRDLEEEPAQ